MTTLRELKAETTRSYFSKAAVLDDVLFSGGRCWDGLNRYAYCHDNPVRYNDPTGHRTGDTQSDVTVVVNAGANSATRTDFSQQNHGGGQQGRTNGGKEDSTPKNGSQQPSAMQQAANWTRDNALPLATIIGGVGGWVLGQVIESAAPIVGDGMTLATDGAALGPAIAVSGGMVLAGQAIKAASAAAILGGIASLSQGKNDGVSVKAEPTTPFGKSVESLKSGDGNWKLSSVHAEPATGQAYKGGTSVEKVYVNSQTGERVVTHEILRGNETLHQTFRPYAKFGSE
jgi:hypothetical protein